MSDRGGAEAGYEGAAVEAGPGYAQVDEFAVDCSVARATLVMVSTGDLGDRVANATSIPSTLRGGDGPDVLFGGAAQDLVKGEA